MRSLQEDLDLVSSEGLSPEIDKLIRSSIQVLTEAAVAKLDCTMQLTIETVLTILLKLFEI